TIIHHFLAECNYVESATLGPQAALSARLRRHRALQHRTRTTAGAARKARQRARAGTLGAARRPAEARSRRKPRRHGASHPAREDAAVSAVPGAGCDLQ